MFKLRMAEGKLQLWIKLVVFMVGFLRTEGIFVETTYLTSALENGAVCLDGSPPAYNLHRGYGTGIDSWLVHIEGGGWCNNVTTCLRRKNSRLGSSLKMDEKLAFSGIMSNKAKFNPDFYNWNRVKIRYCDGASFTGDVEEVDPYTKLHFRGARIWLAVIEELLSKGMKDAENAILSGCSAGGLTSILHCDSFRALLPMGTRVKCLSDAGYFLNVDDLSGEPRIASYFKDTMKLHGSKRNLPASCTTDSEAHLCFFPQYVAPKIQTPLFILNAAYDSWQIRNIVAPTVADPHSYWNECRADIEKCTPKQLKVMQEFRLKFIEAMEKVNRQCTGLFINSCYAHCQTEMQETWYAPDSPVLNKTTIAEAIGDWFYDQNPFQRIDCPYPCDRSCHNRIFDQQEHQIL